MGDAFSRRQRLFWILDGCIRRMELSRGSSDITCTKCVAEHNGSGDTETEMEHSAWERNTDQV